MDDDARKKLEEQGVVFYYNREERLKRMSENAKLYNGELKRKTGFVRVLLDAPGGKQMLFVIIVIIGVIVSLAVFNRPNENTVGGLETSVKAFAFEDKIYVNVKFDKNEKAGNAAVSAEVSAINGENAVADTKTLTGEYTGEELMLRTTFSDFEIKQVSVKTIVNGESKTLSVSVDR